MLENNNIKGARLRAGVCFGLSLGLLAGCTQGEVIEQSIGGKVYIINHTYSGGSSVPFGDTESYTINVDGQLYTCDTKEQCVVKAEEQLGKRRDYPEPTKEVPPLLARPEPKTETPPEDDGVPALLREPKETSFGD